MCALVLAVPTPARAGGFFDDGSFAFDPSAVVRLDFETEVPVPEGDTPPTRVESETALSGEWVVELAPFGDAGVSLSVPPLVRSYRASVWIRGGEGVAVVVASHDGSPYADEMTQLYPTGRITSDGWIELANGRMPVDGARSALSLGVFCPAGCELDAFELLPDGVPEAGLGVACAGATDGACDRDQVCMWSECRHVGGWVPPIPSDREDVTAYLETRLRFLFGPYRERTIDMPAALSAIEGMKGASSPWSYWNSWLLAVRRLHDGHTRTGGIVQFVLSGRKAITACFVEGDADLSHAVAPADAIYRDVLVSHVGGDHHLGLGPGDRLVRVDGSHPIAWYRSLVAHNLAQPSTSNRETFAELVSSLGSAVSRHAHEIEVVRCNALGQTCGGIETISIADLPLDDPSGSVARVDCDNRPLRHVPMAPADHGYSGNDVLVGLVDASSSTEKIYGVEWDSLYTTDGSDGMGPAMTAALQTLTTDGARGAIFDHRLGTGGTVEGPQLVWSFAVPYQPLTFMQTRQRAEDEQPSLAEGIFFFQQALGFGLVDYAGSNLATTIPVALLITEDVSASDWLPLGMKRGGDNVRVFGPYQTNGAFSTRYQLAYWLGMSAVLASGDSFVSDGTALAGQGVEPDVVVLPRQSDLLAARDTVFEAALAWVRQELVP